MPTAPINPTDKTAPKHSTVTINFLDGTSRTIHEVVNLRYKAEDVFIDLYSKTRYVRFELDTIASLTMTPTYP